MDTWAPKASVLSSEDFLRRLETINTRYKDSEEGISMVATDISALFPSMNAKEAGKACRLKMEECD